MESTSRPLTQAIRGLLGLGVAALFGAGTARADPPALHRTATDARIAGKGVGAAQRIVYDRAALERSGAISVAGFLRGLPLNSFGAARPQGGNPVQGFAGVSLHGVGEGRTLVLLDGRPLATDPVQGEGQDLNAIPLAAIERIEILADGASALYGSAAVGGVVNLVSRSGFSGAELSLGLGVPDREGGETEHGHALIGASGPRGSLLAGVSYANRGIVWQRHRDWSRGGVSTFSNTLLQANPFGAGGALVPGQPLAHPVFGSALPGACTGPGFSLAGSGAATRCLYDFTMVGADEAELRNEALFARGRYVLDPDWALYLDASVGRSKAFGRLAPIASLPWLGAAPLLPAGSPNHPAVRFPDAGYDPDAPLFLRHRFVALDSRDSHAEANHYTTRVGTEGRIGDVLVDIGLRSVEARHYTLQRNVVVPRLAQPFIADGRYDIYDPFASDPAVLEAMRATLNEDAEASLEELYATVSTRFWSLPGGEAQLALGAELRMESHRLDLDPLQRSGEVQRGIGRSSIAERTTRAAFVNLLLPVLEPLDLELAVRHDDAPHGNDLSTRLALAFRPLESLALHGSWGESFVAPALAASGLAPVGSVEFVFDGRACLPGIVCEHLLVPVFDIANPALDSEQVRHARLGLWWQPAPAWTLRADAWTLRLEDRIRPVGAGLMVACLDGAVACPPGVSVLPALPPPHPQAGLGVGRDPQTGFVAYVQRGLANTGELAAEGIDLQLGHRHELGHGVLFEQTLSVGWIDDFRIDGGDDLVGTPGRPEFRATLSSQLHRGNLGIDWTIRHVDGTRSTAGLLVADGGSDYGYPRHLPSWTVHDLQASWATPWNARLALGVHNATDQDPPLDPLHPNGFGYDFRLYDGYGRVPYMRYTQSF